MMKVAMVTPFNRERDRIAGGVAGVAKYLGEELAKYPDIRLTMVVPQGTDDAETVCEMWGGVSVYRLARRGIWRHLPGTVYDIFAGRRQVKSFLRKIEPDIVHFQDSAFLAAACERHKVLTIHGLSEKDAVWDARLGVFRWLKWLILKLTEAYTRRRIPNVILISESAARVLPRSKTRKVWRIDNPIEDSFFGIDWEPQAGRIFCCSRILPLKNITGLIEAFGWVVRRAPECRLRIAGAGDSAYLNECKRRAERSGLRERVEFLGRLSVSDVQRELSKANCFAMPSFQEMAPLSISEAMAVGVPVVAAAVGGIPDMVEHGGTGFVIDPNDARDIGDAIGRIISDGPLARSMGRQARISARKRYMASVVARKTVDVYCEILGARRS